jgi:hypothetical protein
MLVRATCTHFNKTYRKEGAEFEYDGPLYEHIEPVEELDEELPVKPRKTRGKSVE